MYNQYDLILTVSDYVKRNILNNAKVSEKKVKVWFNSVDTKKFRLHNGYSDITKKVMLKYNLYSGKVIMFHGRLLPEKGVLEVILAFKKVLNLLPDLRLCILGELQQNNDYHKLLIKTAGALMNKQIIFTGYISYKEIEHYLNIATIFVLPSLWEEPCGLAMLEALAMEKPLITTNSGGIVESASNNTGFILEKDQNIVENIFQKIVWLIDNPEVSREMGKHARREIIKKRNLEYYLSNLNTILESY
ncbi:glycosyltransferase family 4 protein [Bacillus thuringiensis]|uniref:glycosyltransferase family 4 protein n=1 Tax=Bacillus thuringiensis TaxID=1428 RepID=UPI000BF8E1EC|nr:glycosyltransferase family 4 protein [Bacillus thuringiensis]PFN52290.1 hypothetical protein COJ75_24085 [Bacillus thuringiensis]